MSEVKLTRVQVANILSREIMAKPAPVARAAALPAMSEYARREGLEPKKVRVQLLRYA